ncbi:MAG: redox-sensing transcriptional repressor Rex [Candidatus Omnitrophica bacterium]|nr:redox-sensing transcriptional repressor Rex [Candidatus Omnitrophota bacterium]
MSISNNTIERICRIFGYLDSIEKEKIEFISSSELAKAIGATEHTVRKDISQLNVIGFTRKGYEVKSLKKELGRKLNLDKHRKACIVGLGRLGTALLDYEKFQDDGFQIVAGFDCSINKIERIKSDINVFQVNRLKEIVKQQGIELGIIAVPAKSAQSVADRLSEAGVKGILNFSPIKVNVASGIIHLDMNFTSALRVISAQFK